MTKSIGVIVMKMPANLVVEIGLKKYRKKQRG